MLRRRHGGRPWECGGSQGHGSPGAGFEVRAAEEYGEIALDDDTWRRNPG